MVTPQADIREKISEKLYNGLIRADEVFVSDGAKCDIGRLQMMFGPGVTSAVQVSQFAVIAWSFRGLDAHSPSRKAKPRYQKRYRRLASTPRSRSLTELTRQITPNKRY